MSSANARCSETSVMALPPYFTTTVLPWNCSSHGSASTSRPAFSNAASRRLLMCASSCAVRRVLVHVGGGQVVGPDGRGVLAGVEVDGDGDQPARQVDLVAVLGSGAVA